MKDAPRDAKEETLWSSHSDRAKGLCLVVNADFGTSTKPFTVAGLPRKSKRRRHGHY